MPPPYSRPAWHQSSRRSKRVTEGGNCRRSEITRLRTRGGSKASAFFRAHHALTPAQCAHDPRREQSRSSRADADPPREYHAHSTSREATQDDAGGALGIHQSGHRELIPGGHGSSNEAGTDAGEQHALSSGLGRGGHDPAIHRGLRGAIRWCIGCSQERGDRGNRRDPSPYAVSAGRLPSHQRHGREHRIQHAAEIDLEDRPRQLRLLRTAVTRAAGNAGVGHNQIERPRRFDPVPPAASAQRTSSSRLSTMAPRSPQLSATADSRVWSRPDRCSVVPGLAKATASAAPIPDEAPVIRTVRTVSIMIIPGRDSHDGPALIQGCV